MNNQLEFQDWMNFAIVLNLMGLELFLSEHILGTEIMPAWEYSFIVGSFVAPILMLSWRLITYNGIRNK